MNTNRPYISVLFHDIGAADQLLLQVVDADRRLKELGKDYEIIILGENSLETAPESIKKIAGVTGIKFLKTGEKNRTDLIKAGMREASGEYRLFALSDEAPMIELLKLADFLDSDEEVDIAFGKRMDNSGIGNSVISGFGRLVHPKVSDLMTPFVCAKQKIAPVLGNETKFDSMVELMFDLKQNRIEIAEVGVLLHKEPQKHTLKEIISFVLRSVKVFFISIINRIKSR